jgi:hypothetical protein
MAAPPIASIDPTPNAITVNVTPVNDAPVAGDDTTSPTRYALTIAAPGVFLGDTDVENDPLTR